MTPESAARTAPAPTTTPHYLLVALFGGVMGLTGLASAWGQAAVHTGAAGILPARWRVCGQVLRFACCGAGRIRPSGSRDRCSVHPSSLPLPRVLAEYSLPLARALCALRSGASLMFDTPIAPAMQPSLLILVAPFSVGFSAHVSTTGAVDAFAQALYMLMLFLLAVVLHRLRHLRQCCPFRVAWWSASFSLAASAGAALRYAAYARDAWVDAIATALLAIASTVILALLAWTASGTWRGDLQNLSGP